nr:hypothetical protein BaRGS_032747 [Batillaria attramentaria]
MDSVGLFDTVQSHEEVALKIFQAVASMNPGPHAVFYVVPIGQRYTEEEYNAFKRLKHYFGDDITKHMIVLLTHGNRLTEEGVTIEDYLQDTTDDFQQVLKECSNRYVVFNKYLPDMKPQVDSLFRTVRAMLKQNGGRYFQSELTQKVEDKMKEFVAEILGEAERQELAGKQTVKDLTWERETAKQEAEKYQEQSAEAQRRQEELREKLKHSEEARQNAEWEAKQRIVKGQREGWSVSPETLKAPQGWRTKQ